MMESLLKFDRLSPGNKLVLLMILSLFVSSFLLVWTALYLKRDILMLQNDAKHYTKEYPSAMSPSR